MPSMTIRNIPLDLYLELQRQAKLHNQSLEEEVLAILQASIEIGAPKLAARETRPPAWRIV